MEEQQQTEQQAVPQQQGQGQTPEEIIAQLPPNIREYLAGLGDEQAVMELQKIAQMGVENYINTLNQV